MTFTAPFAAPFGFYADSAFNPLSLSPSAWWKADAGTYQSSGGAAAAADGDPVGELQDQSGNGLHLTQTTTLAKPTLRLNKVNGLPGLELDGADWMSRASTLLSAIYGSSQATLFAVFNHNGAANDGALLAHGTGASCYHSYPTVGNIIYYDAGNDSTARISVTQPTGWDNTYHVLEQFRSGSSGQFRVDGVIRLNGTFSGTAANLSTSNTLYFGTLLGGSIIWKGFFVEMLLWNRALTDDERTSMRAYLTDRSGIAA